MQQKEAVQLAKKWQHLLRLDDWDIEILVLSDEAYDSFMVRSNYDYETVGHVDRWRTNRQATIRLRDGRSDEEQRDTIMHELVHILLDEYECLFERTITMAPEPVRPVLSGDLKFVNEKSVCAVTRVIMSLLKEEKER